MEYIHLQIKVIKYINTYTLPLPMHYRFPTSQPASSVLLGPYRLTLQREDLDKGGQTVSEASDFLKK